MKPRVQMQQRTRAQSRVRWSPPAQNAMKVNFDGDMFPKSNEDGEVLATLAEKIHQPYTVETLEIIAARRVVLFSAGLGFLHPIFKGDSEVIIKALSEDNLSLSSIVMPPIFILFYDHHCHRHYYYRVKVHDKMRVDNFVVL